VEGCQGCIVTIGSHQRCVGKTQAHITPKWIIDRLGPFDLDPAAADPRPWDCAERNITEAEDGLAQPWLAGARVWLNPPFLRYQVGRWIQRLAEHGYGTTLLHARTEAGWFEPSGSTPAASCSWPTGSTSTGQMARVNPPTPELRRCWLLLAPRISSAYATVASPVCWSPTGKRLSQRSAEERAHD
jgi:DNA N-6-adenine-methyltransferase (Dam)